MANFFATAISWIMFHWRILLVACVLGIAATCKACVESDEARAQRAQRKQKKELRALADKISTYGRKVHQRYPTGDVIVSQTDLAEQLRKTPHAVATALNLLLAEQKVQETSLAGYWKLNT
jgi:uncharacterized membrane-anchored protein YhcB (DUF1043 family)